MDNIREIITEAVSAPSGDNSQPWWFSVGESSLRIFNLPDRDNPILNFQQSGSYIAHGALIENIVIIAKDNGYLSDVKLFPESTDKNLIAEITFSKSELESEHLRPFIRKRCTNRRPYQSRKLDESTIENLLCRGIDYGEVLVVDQEKKIKKISAAVSTMERVALEHEGIHKLFFGDIIWSEEENKMGKPGLFIKTLEVPIFARLMFKILRFWPMTKFFNFFGFSRVASIGNGRLYSKSGAQILILAKKDTPTDFINAGRLTQRIWLISTSMGLEAQPVTGLLFLARRFIHGDKGDFQSKHIQMVMNSYDVVKREFGVVDGNIPAMLLRVGYAAPPSARSFRMTPQIHLS